MFSNNIVLIFFIDAIIFFTFVLVIDDVYYAILSILSSHIVTIEKITLFNNYTIGNTKK